MMNDELYQHKLDYFRQNEKPEVVLLIANNDDLTRLVIAWGNIIVERVETLPSPSDDSEASAWRWLWENVSYDKAELLQNSTLSVVKFEQKLNSLIGNRVIYPDGTVNSYVQRYLREMVVRLFESKSKARSKKAS